MPSVFWTGKLSPDMKLIVNFSNVLAWITGNARDIAAMKQRMKLGYEGAFSDHVTRYDDVGLEHYTKIAIELLKGVKVDDKDVIDIGCGTGILSLLALKDGATRVCCGDSSEYMLDQCRQKMTAEGYTGGRVDFRQIDAESLSVEDNRYDAAISSMVLGLVPNQQKMVNEMTRITQDVILAYGQKPG